MEPSCARGYQLDPTQALMAIRLDRIICDAMLCHALLLEFVFALA